MFEQLPPKAEEENPLVIIHDEPQPCPYIKNQEARMPLRWPMGMIAPEVMDQYLEQGFRRSGPFLYQTQCDGCQACEPSRVDVKSFNWTRSFRRIKNRGDRELEVRIGRPVVDQTRVDLFNKHRSQRNLGLSSRVMDTQEYSGFLVETVCDTKEISIWKDDQLVAIATTDFGDDSLSLVYCHFDSVFNRYSPGTYSILKHFEIAQQTNRSYVYLGMYVAENQHLNYKARFTPQQRLRHRKWESFET